MKGGEQRYLRFAAGIERGPKITEPTGGKEGWVVINRETGPQQRARRRTTGGQRRICRRQRKGLGGNVRHREGNDPAGGKN